MVISSQGIAEVWGGCCKNNTIFFPAKCCEFATRLSQRNVLTRQRALGYGVEDEFIERNGVFNFHAQRENGNCKKRGQGTEFDEVFFCCDAVMGIA